MRASVVKQNNRQPCRNTSNKAIMQELDKGLTNSLAGRETDRRMEKFRRQVEAWGVSLPPVEPLVLDFGLGQFERIGLIEYWIANELEAGYCGKYLFVFDGQQCPSHSHRVKHETFFVVHGCLEVVLDGRRMTLRPGEVLPVPPGHVHSFQGAGNSLLLELSMPCRISDNCFEDPRTMAWLERLSAPGPGEPKEKRP
jgi:mannose-6-phosphate isomerase-like protein (cupin superfamily)